MVVPLLYSSSSSSGLRLYTAQKKKYFLEGSELLLLSEFANVIPGVENRIKKQSNLNGVVILRTGRSGVIIGI